MTCRRGIQLSATIFVLLGPIAAQKSYATPAIPQCAPGTLTQYEDLGDNGCRLDDKIFGSFSYAEELTGTPNGNQVLVTPINTPGNPGFKFVADPPFSATQQTGQAIAAINFYGRVQPTGNSINDISLMIGGITVTADSSIKVNEGACLGAIVPPFEKCPTMSAQIGTSVTPTMSKTIAEDRFDPTNLVDVNTFITMDPGEKGSADLTTITVQFSEIPEPSSLAVLGLGLVLMPVIRVRFSRRRAEGFG